MGSLFSDDKYSDRAWDWAKDMSRLTYPGWSNIYKQNVDAATSGSLTPGSQKTFDFAKSTLDPWINQQGGGIEDSDIWKTLSGLYSGYENEIDPFSTDLFKGADELYQPTVEPLYDQLMDPLKRGIEGQYGNRVDRMLSSGVRGGALTEALANAAMERDMGLSDMEKTLRAQDIARLDQTQRDRASALTNLAQSIYGTQEAGRLSRAAGLTNAGVSLEQAENSQGLMAALNLSSLLNQLTEADMARAVNMANTGVQGRYLTGQNLAGAESGSNSSFLSGLMSMGSMIGLGMGQSGGGSSAATSAGPELLNIFG